VKTLAAPEYWKPACTELAAADPVMAALIARYPDAILANRGDPFQTLARAIVGQQISVKAADSVWARFAGLRADRQPGTHRHAGTRRARRLRPVAPQGRIPARSGRPFRRWPHRACTLENMEDEAVIAELVDVRGIGRWTAEMFLIFSLRRPDVWPVDDIGLQKAVALHYLGGDAPLRKPCASTASATHPGAPSPPGTCGAASIRRWCSTERKKT
jgi:DNA-3-methyladenine glycosylase II